MVRMMGAKMKAATARIKAQHKQSLLAYLRDQTNRGRTDCALGREFQVSRHTIRNWKSLLGLIKICKERET